MKVRVHRPCVLSWFAISAINRVFASEPMPAQALTSDASCTPSAVAGPFGPLEIAAAARWWDGFVFVTS